MNVLLLESYIILGLLLLTLGLKCFAFANAFLWSAAAYEAAGRLAKPVWVGALGLGLLVQILSLTLLRNPLNLVATVVALVYVLDVRPSVAAASRH